MNREHQTILPNHLRGRSIHKLVIPTVCNLENMLLKLRSVNGECSKLKQWEKRSYQAYIIEEIQNSVLHCKEEELKELIRTHIQSVNPMRLGASCIDIYLVAYVAETYGSGKENFFKYIFKNEITKKENTAQAIWQVGKGDGVYLNILNDDGSVKDWDYIIRWIKQPIKISEMERTGGQEADDMANKDNPIEGREFEIKCKEYFEKNFKDILFDNTNNIEIGLYGNKKPHKFDIVSNKDKIIIECKSHTWTSGDNSPSAKISVWNEAMYYFFLAPKEYKKILFVKKSLNNSGKSLARYYKETHNHLIPENTEIWEFDINTNKHEVMI